jgi:deoxyribonuclease V
MMLSFSRDELLEEQERIAKKVRSLRINVESIRTVCGVDVSYSGKRLIACAAIWHRDAKEITAVSFYSSKENFPYISGFLYKREFKPMVEAVRKLEIRPNLVLIDGHGILHPKKAGLAVFVGVALGLPTIGVAKSLLVGEIGRMEGFLAPISIEEMRLGWLVQKECSRKYYLSPGNLVRVDDLPMLASIWGYGYPPPLRHADKMSREKVNQQ